MSHNSYKQKKTGKHLWKNDTFSKNSLYHNVGVSHVFKIVQMVPNCAKNLQECSCL